jgi:hypothetical protein
MSQYTLYDHYDPAHVDGQLQQQLLALLLGASAQQCMHELDHVLISLVFEAYPLEIVYTWLMPEHEIPADLQQNRDRYFYSRGLLYWFWTSLCDPQLYGPTQPRHPNGVKSSHLHADLLALLTTTSVQTAVNTWFAVCIAWLQVCDIGWYLNERQSPSYRGWQTWHPGEERDIPRYLAGTMALVYM